MPWCPVCKNEYREGITECADCKVLLVESLSECKKTADTLLFSTEKESLAKKFAAYLEYSNIPDYDLSYNEENMLWNMNVSKEDYETAHKLFRGFAIAESTRGGFNEMADKASSDEDNSDENAVNQEDSIEDDFNEESFNGESDKDYNDEAATDDELLSAAFDEDEEEQAETGRAATFVKKEDQYKDYKFSGYSCIAVGGAGFIFCLLNVLSILHIFPAKFSQIVMLIVFAAFIIGGIALLVKSSSFKKMIGDETKAIDEITSWLELSVTNETLNEITDDTVTAEVNYFKYFDYIKDKLFESFPDTDSAMAEALIEEHLAKLI